MHCTDQSHAHCRKQVVRLRCGQRKLRWCIIRLAHVWTIFFLGLIAITPTGAEELDASQTEELLSGGPWKATDTGAIYNYWIWNPDGTLCVKANDPAAESCDDTGSWTRERTEVCYELQWWGKAYGLDKGCFHINKADSGYEAIDPSGLPSLRFTVLERQ